MQILVVDDDPVSRRLMQRIIEGFGHEVLVAEDGEAAWEVFQASRVRFLIVDWIMPKMDGIALCRKIRESAMSGYVYIILLTSKDKKDDIVEGLDAGANDYITKPFDRNELQVRVRAGERILSLERKLTEKNDELRDLNIRLEELACIDPLMDIGNRRSFHDKIEKLHHRACRYAQSYGIVMCDIDNFKAYNDTYGHIAGDGVLKEVASAMKGSIRTADEIFRYGGEEIVIILPGQNLETSCMVADRIRSAVEARGIGHKGSDRGVVTISCGVTAFDNECQQVRWEPVLERADKALYLAKAAGKNMVFSSEKESASEKANTSS